MIEAPDRPNHRPAKLRATCRREDSNLHCADSQPADSSVGLRRRCSGDAMASVLARCPRLDSNQHYTASKAADSSVGLRGQRARSDRSAWGEHRDSNPGPGVSRTPVQADTLCSPWSGWLDLHQRPHGPKPRALAAELHPEKRLTPLGVGPGADDRIRTGNLSLEYENHLATTRRPHDMARDEECKAAMLSH